MKYQYTIHEKKAAADGFFKTDCYTVSYEKFDGGMVEKVQRECVKKGDVVAVIPYDPVRDEILLVEQFRIGKLVRGSHPWSLEIVAGFMDIDGEDEVSTAKRELTEETGCIAKAIYPLIDYYPSPGGSASKIHVFIAEIDSKQACKYTGIESEGEDIRVHTVPLTALQKKIDQNKLDNATAMIAFHYFFQHDWPKKIKNSQ